MVNITFFVVELERGEWGRLGSDLLIQFTLICRSSRMMKILMTKDLAFMGKLKEIPFIRSLIVQDLEFCSWSSFSQVTNALILTKP